MSRQRRIPVHAVTLTSETPLFIKDDALHALIAPHLGRDRFRAALKAYEDSDPLFPRRDPLWHGRYWPAVRKWLDHKQGLGGNVEPAMAQDGPEDFNATRQSARLQTRTHLKGRDAAQILDRAPSGPGHNGVSRRLYPVAARRD